MGAGEEAADPRAEEGSGAEPGLLPDLLLLPRPPWTSRGSTHRAILRIEMFIDFIDRRGHNGGGEVDNCKEKRVVMQQIEFLFLR